MVFLDEFTSWVISAVFVIPHLALLVYGVKFFINYRGSEHAIIQSFYSALIAYWGITNVIWFLPHGTLDFLSQVFVFSSGIISLLLAQVLIAFTLYEYRSMLSGYSHILNRLAALFLTLSLGIIMTQFLQGKDTLFRIGVSNGHHFYVVFHPVGGFLILIGELLFSTSLKKFGDSRKKLLTNLQDQNLLLLVQMLQRGVFLGITLYVVGIMMLPIFQLEELGEVAVGIATMIISIGLFISLLLSSQDPFLHLHNQKHLKLLLEKGIVGWIVVKVGDLGPDVHAISDELVVSRLYSREQLVNEAIALVTVPGHGEQYRETMFMIPFGNSQDVAICRSLLVQDPSLNDPRFEKKAYVVYAVIIPSYLTPMLKNFGEITLVFDQFFNKGMTVQSLSSADSLHQITLELLGKIFM